MDNFLAIDGATVCGFGCFAGFSGNIGDDGLMAYGTIPPIDVSARFHPGTQALKFELKDFGVVLAHSPLWLLANCEILR